MFSPWTLASFALAYTCLLFFIAWLGDRKPVRSIAILNSPWLYSLTLAVYCTSWTFFGAVGQAVNNGWDFLPIYLGPALIFIVASPLLFKIIAISKQQGITSIADFIATRHGKSQPLAMLVTLVAIAGVVPYITLQLKAVTMAFDSLSQQHSEAWFADTALIVALLMAVFSVLFGTRRIDASEHQNGLMLAIGFESLIKLFAFVAIGVFVIWKVFGGITQLYEFTESHPEVSSRFATDFFDQGFFTQTLLAMMAIICLPRQFHTGVVENRRSSDLSTARWLFPLYLALFTVFVVPIAISGMVYLPEQTHQADRYILTVPIHFQQPELALLAFLGGVSAATGMVIVSSVALSIMVCNELIIPLYLNRTQKAGELPQQITPLVRRIRRASIFVILLLAYGLNDAFNRFEALASIGLLSFAAVSQFAPVLVGGLYWKKGHKRGAALGIMGGFLVWFYCLLLPLVLPENIVNVLHSQGLFGFGLIRPYALFGLEGLDPLSHGVFWSLAVNMFCYVYFSKTAVERPLDRNQAILFVDVPTHYESLISKYHSANISVQDLMSISSRCLGKEATEKAFALYAQQLSRKQAFELLPDSPATIDLYRFTEKMLARVMGSSSARILLGTMLSRQSDDNASAVAIMDEAAELIQFNHQLLQTTIETISHGICVVDKNLNIVAWNNTYLKLFEYPDNLIQLGKPIAEVYRYNAERGFYEGNIEDAIEKRLALLKQGGPHRFERELPNGIYVQVRGTPMADGGFVSTYLDITENKMDERALRQMNESLEMMVADRTSELSALNKALQTANEGKTRFLAAAGHDLMQPLNAAHLFTSSLQQKLQANPHATEEQEILNHIENSLHVAEHLINTLLDISRLDTGTIQPKISTFNIHDLLQNLATEFSVIAKDNNLALNWVDCNLWVKSDDKLLRRVVQNLLLNAVRYTPQGTILFGCRRRGSQLEIQVWDTGVGIPEDQLDLIFKEFHRIRHRDLDASIENKGLGLGLAIAQRICLLLEHNLVVKSQVGKGTVFSISVPITSPPKRAQQLERNVSDLDLSGLHVFCVDNEAMILNSIHTLLEQWQCRATTAHSLQSALQEANALSQAPDVLLVDYQLDNEVGFDVIQALDDIWEDVVPVILMTADHSEHIKNEAAKLGYYFLQKPITPDSLRNALHSMNLAGY